MNSYDLYQRASDRLDALIEHEPPTDRSLAAIQARSEQRLIDMADFLELLGNPHRSVPVIHVAGTSGKGSTATAIAAILREAGYRTLLHTSPYLQVSTEKIQIGDRLVDAQLFSDLTDRVLNAAASFDQARITYGEAWVALVALAIEHVRPDVAIIEVGAGGWYDLTNVVEPKVAVITTIGIDHTESLGSTIQEIAWHKAGVIKSVATVVFGADHPDAIAEINLQIAAEHPTRVTRVRPDHLQLAQTESGHWSWSDPTTGQRFVAGIPGQPQALNGALAVAAARDFAGTLDHMLIQNGLSASRIAARFERVSDSPIVVLDGAHNPQKIEALLPDLLQLPQPRIGVVGFIVGKRFEEMLGQIAAHLDGIVITQPQIEGKPGLNIETAADELRVISDIPIETADDPGTAITIAEGLAGSAGSVIVTGSLYLCGRARDRWHDRRQIVEQQFQWPEREPPFK